MKSFFSGRNLFVCKSATDGFDVVFHIFSKKKTLNERNVISCDRGAVRVVRIGRFRRYASRRLDGRQARHKFMADFDATKSDYLIFTVGQNAGVYASPNAQSEVRCAPREDAGR